MGILEQLVLKEYRVLMEYLVVMDRREEEDYLVIKVAEDALVHLVYQDQPVQQVYQETLAIETTVLSLMELTWVWYVCSIFIHRAYCILLYTCTNRYSQTQQNIMPSDNWLDRWPGGAAREYKDMLVL